MKPSKNRVFCNDCHRVKMLFKTAEEAQNFIDFNKDEILEESEKTPIRAYYCELCGGWHVTSRSSENNSRTRGEKHYHTVSRLVNLQMLIDNAEKETDDFARIQKIKECRDLFDEIKEHRTEDIFMFNKLMKRLARLDTNFCEDETLNDCIISFKAFLDKADTTMKDHNIPVCINMLNKAFDLLSKMQIKGIDDETDKKFKRKINKRISKLQHDLNQESKSEH